MHESYYRQFRSGNETSTRSFPGTNIFTVVVSFPGTKVHGNETSIIQDLDKGIKYSDKSEYFFHLGKAHIPNVLFRFGIGGEFLCCLR